MQLGWLCLRSPELLYNTEMPPHWKWPRGLENLWNVRIIQSLAESGSSQFKESGFFNGLGFLTDADGSHVLLLFRHCFAQCNLAPFLRSNGAILNVDIVLSFRIISLTTWLIRLTDFTLNNFLPCHESQVPIVKYVNSLLATHNLIMIQQNAWFENEP